MALLFCDSFDHYTSLADLSLKWQQAHASNQLGAYGRNGTNGLRIIDTSGTVSFVRRTLPANKATVIVGAGVRVNATGGTTPFDPVIFAFMESGTTQIDVRFNQNTNLLYVTRNGTTLATGTTPLNYGTYYHIEFKATIDNATGTYTLRINEVQELTASGVDTQATAVASADSVQLGVTLFNTTNSVDYDDLYICDSLGGVNNDFLGDCRVQCLFPSGPGATSAWTPSTGVNWQNVDDAAPDADATYNASGTPGNIDTYGFTNLTPTTGTVKGIQTVIDARKDDAGTHTIAPVIHQTIDYAGTTVPVATTYGFLLQAYDVNPATSAAFTITEINADEFGVKQVA